MKLIFVFVDRFVDLLHTACSAVKQHVDWHNSESLHMVRFARSKRPSCMSLRRAHGSHDMKSNIVSISNSSNSNTHNAYIFTCSVLVVLFNIIISMHAHNNKRQSQRVIFSEVGNHVRYLHAVQN